MTCPEQPSSAWRFAPPHLEAVGAEEEGELEPEGVRGPGANSTPLAPLLVAPWPLGPARAARVALAASLEPSVAAGAWGLMGAAMAG